MTDQKDQSITDDERAEWERLCKAATPGPWRECGQDRGGCTCRMVWSEPIDDVVASAYGTNPDDPCRCATGHGRREDAAFIAVSRSAMPRLLAENIALKSKVARALEPIHILRGREIGYADDVLDEVAEILEEE